MRNRIVPALVGLTLIVGALTALGSAAHADPPPVPVNITAPGAVTAHALHYAITGSPIWSSASGTRLQPFVAQASGRLSSFTGSFDSSGGLTARVYAADQLSIGAPNGLTPEGADLYLGDSIGTVTTAPVYWPGGNVTGTFTSPGTVTAGNTYWVVMTNADGLGVEFRSGGAGYAHFDDGYRQPGYDYLIDIDVDATPVAVALSPAAANGAHGWYSGDVTATYTCLPAVDTCPTTATIGDGTEAPSGTVTLDNGDTSFSWFHTLLVDGTQPTISGEAAPLGSGFRVTWTCDDETSGIDTCPPPTDVTGIGSDTTATGEAVDDAGNTRSGAVTGLVAATHAPTLTINGVTPGKTYAYGSTVTPTCTTSGARPAIAASPAAPVTCTGTTTHRTNKDGSVTWTYVATAVDPDPLGGTSTSSVSWTVAAKAAPKPQISSFVVKGLPRATKHGYPVIDHRKTYEVSFVFTNAKGQLVKGKPIWLHSVVTNRASTKGKPKAELVRFHKVRGVWTKTFTPGYDYAGQYRKFGVIAPDGKRYTVVVYVK